MPTWNQLLLWPTVGAVFLPRTVRSDPPSYIRAEIVVLHKKNSRKNPMHTAPVGSKEHMFCILTAKNNKNKKTHTLSPPPSCPPPQYIPSFHFTLSQASTTNQKIHDGPISWKFHNSVCLVGGFNPCWKICSSNWMISPSFGVNIKHIWNHHVVNNLGKKTQKNLSSQTLPAYFLGQFGAPDPFRATATKSVETLQRSGPGAIHDLALGVSRCLVHH